jgi:hypothetical protein
MGSRTHAHNGVNSTISSIGVIWARSDRRLPVDIDALLEKLGDASRLDLSPDELAGLLEEAELVREEDTCISGMIRVLCLRNIVLVQEETPDREVLVRIRPTREAAEEFVAHRLETYERMWDGCGCKVDYSER